MSVGGSELSRDMKNQTCITILGPCAHCGMMHEFANTSRYATARLYVKINPDFTAELSIICVSRLLCEDRRREYLESRKAVHNATDNPTG